MNYKDKQRFEELKDEIVNFNKIMLKFAHGLDSLADRVKALEEKTKEEPTIWTPGK